MKNIKAVELIINTISGSVVITLIISVGLGLMVITGFYPLRKLPEALRCFVRAFRSHAKKNDGVSSYQALCTALAATVGTGNLAGVAGAIAIGGPGAMFWMWISGCLGMMLKFTEVVLAMCFRKRDSYGKWVGGPMYIIKSTMPKSLHVLAYIYSFFGIVAVFGIGNAVQVNTIMGTIDSMIIQDCVNSRAVHIIIGAILSVCVYRLFKNESTSIGRMTTSLVPLASGTYILLSLGAIFMNIDRLPTVIVEIIRGAFHPSAVTGGVIGSMFIPMRVGIARGIFTNEAGLGTASIAHAEVETNDAIQQGLMGITEVFIDTIVICSLTGFAILCSDIPIHFGVDQGILLTIEAFRAIYGNWCVGVISILTTLLAIATILGWGLYGLRCTQFIFGNTALGKFALFQASATFVGAILTTSTTWVFSELVNALMAIPNLATIIYLSPYFIGKLKAHKQ